MKKLYVISTILLAVIVTSISAQRTVDVATFNPGDPVYLNDVIMGDTNADGSRIDSNTIYVLENAGWYPVTATIENRFPLTIVADDLEGPKPTVYPSVGGGLESSRLFIPRDDITVKNLYIRHLDDLDQPVKNMFRVKGDDARIWIEDCHLDHDVQAPIRGDGENLKIYIKNCIVSNMDGDYNNGRGLDTRGNSQDTIWIENTTYYNIGARVLRTDDEEWNYLYFSNNTVVNTGRRVLDLSKVNEAVITHNIMINCGIIGQDTASTRAIINMDTIGTGESQDILIRNNNYYIDPEFVSRIPDSATVVPLFDEEAQMFVDSALTEQMNFNFDVEFNKGPVPNYDQTSDWFANPVVQETMPEFDTVGQKMFDFGCTNNAVAGAGEWGAQLGDKNWTAVREEFAGVDFETTWEKGFWNQFSNTGGTFDNLMIVENPDKTGINTSDHVMKFVVEQGSDPWVGAISKAYGNLSITEDKHWFELMVWKDVARNVGLKVEDGAAALEKKDVIPSVTGEWEKIMLDFSERIGETFVGLVVFPDFVSDRPDGTTVYFDNIQLVSVPTDVNDIQALGIEVYPNPASDYFTVRYPGMTKLVVMDVLGKTVKSINMSGEDQTTLSVEDLVNGLYFIRVSSGNRAETTKLLVK